MNHRALIYAAILLTLQACVFGRDNLERNAYLSVSKDFHSFKDCHSDPERPLPRISIGEEAFYDWLANEIQYPSGDRMALEHEWLHYFNHKASRKCVSEQAAYYRMQYKKTKTKLLHKELELFMLPAVR